MIEAYAVIEATERSYTISVVLPGIQETVRVLSESWTTYSRPLPGHIERRVAMIQKLREAGIDDIRETRIY